MRKKLVTAGLVAALSLGALAPAMAVTVNVGGGVWEYGTNGSVAFSNHYHPRINHGSTVSANGQNYYSGCAVAGAWSMKSVTQIPNVSYGYYYSYC